MSSRGVFYIPRITPNSGLFFEDRGETYVFAALLKALSSFTGRAFPAIVFEHSDTAVNEYVTNYGMVIGMTDHEGNKTVISAQYRNNLPSLYVDRLRSFLQFMPGDIVLWAKNVFDTPQPAPAKEVVYGEKPEQSPRRLSKTEIAAKWQHPDALSSGEMDYLTGKKSPLRP